MKPNLSRTALGQKGTEPILAALLARLDKARAALARKQAALHRVRK